MTALLNLITRLFDGIFYPFSRLNPWYALITISVLTGILMVTIFSKVSNQKKMGRAKNLIKAHFLEIQLYKDDFRQLLSSQKKIIRYNLTYLKLALFPATIMFIPVLFILIQLNLRLGNRPLLPGETVNIRAVLRNQDPLKVDLSLPSGVRLNLPPLRIPALQEVNWQLAVEKAGNFELGITVERKKIIQKLAVSDRLGRCYLETPSSGLAEIFLNPGLGAYFTDNSPLKLIETDYPKRDFSLGITILPEWLVIFFITSVIAGLTLKKIFKIN
ncbi:MAG: hypothetical protein ACE5GM_03085 [bacterium]